MRQTLKRTLPKRFWKSETVHEVPGGWEIRLDDKPLRTPAKAPLVVPTGALARAIAGEWAAQTRHVDPETMPLTRMANSAIDKVAPNRAAVVEMLAEYGANDLLCYRAEHPQALHAREAAAWDPWLDWARKRLGADLVATRGIVPVDQPPEALAALRAPFEGLDPFALAAFHDLVTISGSLVLALAALAGEIDADELWRLSRIDEDWQEGQWGTDSEAAAGAAKKEAALRAAVRALELLGRRGNSGSPRPAD